MKKTSPLVLALLFAKVAADDVVQDIQDEIDVVQDIQDQAEDIWDSTTIQSPLKPMHVQVSADAMFNMYANGSSIGSGSDYTETYEFTPEVREADTISIEVESVRYGGQFILTLDGEETHVEQGWVCKDVEVGGSAPHGWNENAYDDSTWLPAHMMDTNDPATTVSKWSITNDNFSTAAQWLWTEDWRSTHIICRLNRAPWEDRNKDAGECDAEMHQFQTLLNNLILHHQAESAADQQSIIDLEGQLGFAHTDIANLQKELDDANTLYWETVDKHNAAFALLQKDYDVAMADLFANLTEDCDGQISDKTTAFNQQLADAKLALTTEHNETVANLENQHAEDTAQAASDAAKAKADAVADEQERLNAEYTAEVNKLIGEHTETVEGLAEDIDALTAQKDKKYFDDMAAKEQEYEASLLAIEAENSRQAAITYGKYEADIDALTRKHDYLYESCTTVQVVDGELVIN